MKKTLAVVFLLSLLSGLVFADMQNVGPQLRTLDSHEGTRLIPQRTAPSYTFSRNPVSLLTSFSDYMPGSYNGLPLRLIPDSAGGGYFMTYQAARTATATRRVFYAYISPSGSVISSNEIGMNNVREGYPTMAVDPVSGKPMYAWHANADTDAQLEVLFVSDAFIDGIDGLWNTPQVIVNNPWTIDSTYDNEFIWPTATIGPSPVNGKRRIYVVSRNSVTHTGIPSENALFAYADFNAADLENGNTLNWSYTTIPTLNTWNMDTMNERRPNLSIACDNAGNVYYFGYHTAQDLNDNPLNEPDVDVFKSTAYGTGAWTRQVFSSSIPTWNPPTSPGGAGYFNEDGVPYSDLKWKIVNSNHSNASVDDLGRIHFPALWGLSTPNGSYFPNLQFVKDLVFDTVTNTLSIKEVYPQKDPNDSFNAAFTPWDMVAPWGVVDEYLSDGYGGTYPAMATDWNFSYWNSDSHGSSMMFHLSNQKITEGNGHGMLAMVWQNSNRARLFRQFGDGNYSAYANAPEIFISVSSDNGANWSEPITLNNVDTAQFVNLKPMYVYPADKVKYVGMQGNQKIGKLGLMFYDDYTWGSNVIAATEFPNDGGRVMFTELQIVFPPATAVTDPFGSPTVLSSSMVIMAGVMIDGVMASNGDVVAAYVNVGGVPQLRGKGTVTTNSGVTGCLLQVYTESTGETVFFKVWDASANEVLDVSQTVSSIVQGTVGEWPNNLFWLHANHGLQQSISLQMGWNMVSLNVHPDDMQITSIFAGIMPHLLSVKSSDGVFFPNNPFNTLTSLSDGRGYYVKVSQNCTLQVSGTAINVSVPIALAAGWNLAGFTPQASMGIDVALASIAGNLQQVKGVEGVYIPGNPFNTLTSLSPGRAYWIKLSNSASLVYPASGRSDEQALLPVCEIWDAPEVKTNSQVILVDVNVNANDGDFLAAFVGDELRGLESLKLKDGKLGALMQVFTDEAGETITFKLFSSANNTLHSLAPALSSAPGETLGDFNANEFISLKSDNTETPAIATKLLNAYPNPFKNGTTIMLEVEKDAANLKVDIFNLRGQRVSTVFSGMLQPGENKLWWSGKDDNGNIVGSGIYFCRMTSGNINQNIKLMILK